MRSWSPVLGRPRGPPRRARMAARACVWPVTVRLRPRPASLCKQSNRLNLFASCSRATSWEEGNVGKWPTGSSVCVRVCVCVCVCVCVSSFRASCGDSAPLALRREPKAQVPPGGRRVSSVLRTAVSTVAQREGRPVLDEPVISHTSIPLGPASFQRRRRQVALVLLAG